MPIQNLNSDILMMQTASLIEAWIDETESRTWFLSEIVG